eukprot:scaffold2425_cov302-Pinguiococcus_pyrenoidosus.AAC.1
MPRKLADCALEEVLHHAGLRTTMQHVGQRIPQNHAVALAMKSVPCWSHKSLKYNQVFRTSEDLG